MNPVILIGRYYKHMPSGDVHKLLMEFRPAEYDKDGQRELVTISTPLLTSRQTFSWLGNADDFKKEFTLVLTH